MLEETDMSDALADLRRALAGDALALLGVTSAADARALYAPREPADDPLGSARSVVVVASGGRAFWERLPAAARAGEEHPIDRVGRGAIARALSTLPAGSRLVEQEATDRFDLRRLAERAGLGVVSPHLLLLIHPVFGPWVSVRGLVAVPVDLPASGPLAYDPCGACARPCLDACPVGAYSRAASFDVDRCATHRLRSDDVPPPATHCAERCHARYACVVGPEHAYGDAESRHRHRAGLPMLRAWKGVEIERGGA